jgi:hypothetical protein
MVSSVRRGLADVRDAVRPMITVLGHEPVRFEDFTAQPVPPRAACVEAVTTSDIYLLLLGEHYGERMPDTGRAPTAEEWAVARPLGKPIVVFKRTGIDPDSDQAAFIAEVESYRTGVFRDSFGSTAELLEKLPAAIEAAAASIQPLRPRQLEQPAPVVWRDDARYPTATGTVLETHLVPVGSVDRLRAGDLNELSRRVARVARDSALFDEREPLDVSVMESEVAVRLDRRSTHEERGVRVRTDHSVMVWRALPSEMGGTIYDEDEWAKLVTADLRTAAQLGVLGTEEVSIAIGLDRVDLLARRTSPTSWEHPFFGRSTGPVRIEADEAMPVTALERAATEIARGVVARLSLRLKSGV